MWNVKQKASIVYLDVFDGRSTTSLCEEKSPGKLPFVDCQSSIETCQQFSLTWQGRPPDDQASVAKYR